MTISSIRFGFATNSSSSHSVVMGANTTESNSEIAENYEPNSGVINFGWGYREHTDRNSIINYAVYDLFYKTSNGQYSEGLAIFDGASSSLQTILEKYNKSIKEKDWLCEGIDHQSAGTVLSTIGLGNRDLEEVFWTFVRGCGVIIEDHDNH